MSFWITGILETCHVLMMVHLGTFLKSCPIGGPETTKARCPLLTAIETRTDGRTYYGAGPPLTEHHSYEVEWIWGA